MSAPVEPGRLYGVGVGPGDPGLLTLRAREVLEGVDVVAHFCKAGRRGIARGIVDAALGTSRREHAMAYPFTTEVPLHDPRYALGMNAFYDTCADQITGMLRDGLSVAVICEGDPFFYGSYLYLHRRLAHRVPTEVVAGVTGMSACWTRAGAPITSATMCSPSCRARLTRVHNPALAPCRCRGGDEARRQSSEGARGLGGARVDGASHIRRTRFDAW